MRPCIEIQRRRPATLVHTRPRASGVSSWQRRQLTRRLAPDPATGGLYGAAYALEPGRERILVCSESGSRQVWDMTTQRVIFSIPTDAEQLPRLRGNYAGLCAYLADLSDDGRQVVAPDPGGEIMIWNVATGRETRRLSKRYANPGSSFPLFAGRPTGRGRLLWRR